MTDDEEKEVRNRIRRLERALAALVYPRDEMYFTKSQADDCIDILEEQIDD